MAKAEYDCLKCIGTCCSVYDQVPVTRRDVLRLARHFLLSEEEATRRFTKMSTSGRILRRKRDPLLGRTCMFHDLQKRVCGIYEARPQVCREWPAHGDGCVYYDLLQFERKQQGDETIVPLIQIRPLKDVLRNNRRMKG
ncbi:MAG TPA: YkgJ family cysteine cluster protein [Pyrinomonadaceae bacterium]|nr:YkgJ family cysteine cluster protein [Pyrinomonadaceae bacterium]